MGVDMIADKATARAILLAGAAELAEMEFDRMAHFYATGEHDSVTLSSVALAHVWASIARESRYPLGSINSEIGRLAPNDAHAALVRIRDKLKSLDDAAA